MPAVTLYLRSRAEWAHAIAHTMAGIMLLLAASRFYPVIDEHPFGFWFSLCAGIFLLLGTLFHKVWHHHPKHLLAFMSVMGGLILWVEAYEQAHSGTNYIHYLTAFAGILYVVFGLVFFKLRRLAYVNVTQDGLVVKPNFTRKDFYPWRDLSTVKVQPWVIQVQTVKGKVNSYPLDHNLQTTSELGKASVLIQEYMTVPLPSLEQEKTSAPSMQDPSKSTDI